MHILKGKPKLQVQRLDVHGNARIRPLAGPPFTSQLGLPSGGNRLTDYGKAVVTAEKKNADDTTAGAGLNVGSW